jgi:uncharacterized protein (DUF433 family)
MTATLVAPGIERRSDRGLAIAGSRLTLYEIMDVVKAGWSSEKILELYPLTAEQLQDAYNYFAASGEAFEAEYQEVVRYSEELERYYRAKQEEILRAAANRPRTPEEAALRAKYEEHKAKMGIRRRHPSGIARVPSPRRRTSRARRALQPGLQSNGTPLALHHNRVGNVVITSGAPSPTSTSCSIAQPIRPGMKMLGSMQRHIPACSVSWLPRPR